MLLFALISPVNNAHSAIVFSSFYFLDLPKYFCRRHQENNVPKNSPRTALFHFGFQFFIFVKSHEIMWDFWCGGRD